MASERQRALCAGVPAGHMRVTCWCEATYVAVTPDDVWNGRTASCGADRCTPPAGTGQLS